LADLGLIVERSRFDSKRDVRDNEYRSARPGRPCGRNAAKDNVAPSAINGADSALGARPVCAGRIKEPPAGGPLSSENLRESIS
jgi:hypothetical protein